MPHIKFKMLIKQSRGCAGSVIRYKSELQGKKIKVKEINLAAIRI